MIRLCFAILCALACADTAGAQTIVAKRNAMTLRLVPLKKMTVGPDDQYRGSVDPSGRYLAFTHKADLVAHLQAQNLKTGEVSNLLPVTSDSHEASFSPDGRLAFTYFKFNARGDICLVPAMGAELKTLSESDIRCLKRAGTDKAVTQAERSNPFWKSSREIGFVSRDLSTQIARIVVENIDSGAQSVLAEGNVFQPSMAPGGRYLAYNEIKGSERRLVVKDLSTGQTRAARFAIPGITGFPAMGPGETHLYFSHYLNDTNNDRLIDGNDNAVIFRAPIAAIFDAKGAEGGVFPEQLTSVETSCSFPRPAADSLLMTCAFEGSLDLYRAPLTGIVPVDWTTPLLTSAVRTSRSYQDRILILNTMKYRRAVPATEHAALDERLLGDYLLADDTSAALYYRDLVRKSAKASERAYLELLGLYLSGRSLKKAQASENDVTRQFEREVLALDEKAKAAAGEPRMQALVRGLLRDFLNRPGEAENFLKTVRFQGKARPMERYLAFILGARTYRRDLPKAAPKLVEVYRQAMTAPEIGEESQIYYAFSLLKELHGASLSRSERARIVDGMLASQGLPPAVVTLLKAETVSLKIIAAEDQKAKMAVYRDLDQLMTATKANYFLRKALYVRAIVNFAEAAEFFFMRVVVNNWLRFTTQDDTEYGYARAVFADTSLEQAYDSLGKKNLEYAANYFYESLTLTDDLESHWGYLGVRMSKGERATIDARYKDLKERQFLDDNMKFVEAALLLMESETAADKDPKMIKHLDGAIAKLEAMEQDRDSAIRYLLLGYCYSEKMRRLASGLEIDQDLLRSAHRNLMLAYDLGRENERVKASALTDLGLLHQRAGNQGLAARFFALRKRPAVLDRDERVRLAWLSSRSLFLSHQPLPAAAELEELGADIPAPVLERKALYYAIGGKFAESAEAYKKLFATGQVTGDMNLAKTQLGYGYALLKLKKETEARAMLRGSLEAMGRLGVIKKSGDRPIDFEPARIELVGLGFLAQVGSPAERLEAAEKRAFALRKSKKMIDDWQTLLIQNRMQAAELASKTGDASRAAAAMEEALKLAEEFGDGNQYLSNAVFRAASGYLSHALMNRAHYASGQGADRIRKVVTKTLAAYDAQKTRPAILDVQKQKLRMLWAAYSARVLSKPDPTAPSVNAAVSGLADLRESTTPAAYAELEALAKALQ